MVIFLVIVAAILFFVFDQAFGATLILCSAFMILGWCAAHNAVAIECERFGKFYVSNEIYQCVKIEDIDIKGEKK